MTAFSWRDPGYVGSLGSGGSLLLYPAYVQDYLDRVTAADVAAGDTSGLERGVTDALSKFLQDLVAINYLGISNNVIAQAPSKIKAAPVMAGALTLEGAMVPIVGPTSTRFGTESGWNYSRKTGVRGNGTNNYILTNYLVTAQTLDVHAAVYTTSVTSQLRAGYISALSSNNVRLAIETGVSLTFRGFHSCLDINAQQPPEYMTVSNVLYGLSRSTSSSYTLCRATFEQTQGQAYVAPAENLVPAVFASRAWNGGISGFNSARIMYYSLGDSLALPALHSLVNSLRIALNSAIP